jgi:hypothetical protein
LVRGLSLEGSTQIIGVSKSWACQLRCRFIAGRLVGASDAPKAGGRNREKFFHNWVFTSLDALEDQLALALRPLENNPEIVRPIVSWDWIMSSLITSFMK